MARLANACRKPCLVTTAGDCCEQAAMAETGRDRKLEDTVRISRSEEELMATGKWLSREQQLQLQQSLLKYFAAWKPAGPAATADEAFQYQGRVLTWLLVGGSMPVPRTSMLCRLKINESLRFNEQHGVYELDVGSARHAPSFDGAVGLFSSPASAWPS
jgi:hypothetical protein